MQTFLSQLAETIIKEEKEQLGDFTIVLPSRRSIVFLREEFKNQLTQTSWLPKFFSLEDFVVDLGQFQQLDRIDLIFELYQVHIEIEGSKAEPFHEFLNWGNLLLQDFNEIDRYLVDGEDLYGFLTEAKAIESWNLSGEPLTEFQSKYLHFWRNLREYYTLFKAKLIAKNQFYQGLGFRRVAEQLEDGSLVPKRIKRICFAGFNALTKAEEKIIEFFEKENNASIYWDGDEYYMSDKYQEAGKFLREQKKKRGSNFSWISNELLTSSKKIDIYGVSGNIGQAKLIGTLLNQNELETNKTAVVLSDEELLIPVLESIPLKVNRINVTMGYPVKSSPFYFWVESYFKLFRNLTKKENPTPRFCFPELSVFLRHSAFHYLNRIKISEIEDALDKLEKRKSIFVQKEDLKEIEDCLTIPIFTFNLERIEDLIKNILTLILLIREEGSKRVSDLDKEILFFISNNLRRLNDVVYTKKLDLSVESILKLLKEILSSESVDFIGEPLGGLQIMGVLESRTLDFEHLIISSVNEGVLPSGKTQNSFIPFDIKLKFGLPSYKEKDSIFAYHFYRLLQRSKVVSIIYNTKVDQLQGGERSRFIEQLLHEIPQKNKNVQIKEYILSPPLIEEKISELVVSKNDEILGQVKQHLKQGLSASALNTYLSCSLDYYFKYILKLKEKDTVEEKIEDSTLGTIIHNCLESLYKPIVNQLIDKIALKGAIDKLDSVLMLEFEKALHVKPTNGINKLSFEVAKQLIVNLINYDLKTIENGNEIYLVGLEVPFEQSISLNNAISVNQTISLKGKIDRIDKLNGKKRIIDYKTGGTTSDDLNYRELSGVLKGNKPKAIQMMIYKFAYELEHIDEPVEAGIISLRNLSLGFIPLNNRLNVREDLTTILEHIIEELLDSDINFSHSKDASFCAFCSNKKEAFN